jgi:hypothetical protein
VPRRIDLVNHQGALEAPPRRQVAELPEDQGQVVDGGGDGGVGRAPVGAADAGKRRADDGVPGRARVPGRLVRLTDRREPALER